MLVISIYYFLFLTKFNAYEDLDTIISLPSQSYKSPLWSIRIIESTDSLILCMLATWTQMEKLSSGTRIVHFCFVD